MHCVLISSSTTSIWTSIPRHNDLKLWIKVCKQWTELNSLQGLPSSIQQDMLLQMQYWFSAFPLTTNDTNMWGVFLLFSQECESVFSLFPWTLYIGHVIYITRTTGTVEPLRWRHRLPEACTTAFTTLLSFNFLCHPLSRLLELEPNISVLHSLFSRHGRGQSPNDTSLWLTGFCVLATFYQAHLHSLPVL